MSALACVVVGKTEQFICSMSGLVQVVLDRTEQFMFYVCLSISNSFFSHKSRLLCDESDKKSERVDVVDGGRSAGANMYRVSSVGVVDGGRSAGANMYRVSSVGVVVVGWQ